MSNGVDGENDSRMSCWLFIFAVILSRSNGVEASDVSAVDADELGSL